LEAIGYTFRSNTDTEVVLNSFSEWGKDAIKRFNGMFSLALYDRKQNEVFLARDRYGIKPLYYTIIQNSLIFGSEVKAIIANPSYSVAMDEEGLFEYLTFQNFFTDHTLFKDVKLLPAGTCMVVSLEKRKIGYHRYWDYDFTEENNYISTHEYEEELDRLFVQAVNRQLVGDVDIGAYLSGGVDSGGITSIASSQLTYMKSFTCGFDLNSASGVELGYDERQVAEYMSYLFKTEHYEMVLKAGDMERIMPVLAKHIEEPRVGQSYPNFYAAKLASKFVKVVLSGAGGDELFAGYPWRYHKSSSAKNFNEYVDGYYKVWQRILPSSMNASIFSPIWSKVRDLSTKDIFRNVFNLPSGSYNSSNELVNYSLQFEAKTFLHGLLVIEDKLSMAHSLENRVPFLDNDVVDFAMKIPVKYKLRKLKTKEIVDENEAGHKPQKYFFATNDGKLLLRKMLSRYVPENVFTRPKQGFSAPDASWFKGESINFVRRRLYDGNPRIYEFLDKKAVHKLVDEHLNGKENRRLLIWSLLSLEEFCDSFLN